MARENDTFTCAAIKRRLTPQECVARQDLPGSHTTCTAACEQGREHRRAVEAAQRAAADDVLETGDDGDELDALGYLEDGEPAGVPAGREHEAEKSEEKTQTTPPAPAEEAAHVKTCECGREIRKARDGAIYEECMKCRAGKGAPASAQSKKPADEAAGGGQRESKSAEDKCARRARKASLPMLLAFARELKRRQAELADALAQLSQEA